jgi:hypothetical protein
VNANLQPNCTVNWSPPPAGLNLPGGQSARNIIQRILAWNIDVVDSTQLTIDTTSLPAGEVGVSYSQNLTATGGTLPHTWSITAGALPPGLSLASSAGAISGTPTTAGASSFTVRVSDNASHSTVQALSITIIDGPNITTSSRRCLQPDGHRRGRRSTLPVVNCGGFLAGRL